MNIENFRNHPDLRIIAANLGLFCAKECLKLNITEAVIPNKVIALTQDWVGASHVENIKNYSPQVESFFIKESAPLMKIHAQWPYGKVLGDIYQRSPVTNAEINGETYARCESTMRPEYQRLLIRHCAAEIYRNLFQIILAETHNIILSKIQDILYSFKLIISYNRRTR